MNLNNIFKKVSGIALAGAIAFAGFAGSVNAASTTPNGPVNGGKEKSTEAFESAPSIKKTVTGGNYFGGATFNFTIQASDLPADTYKGYTSRQASDFVSIADGGALTLENNVREGTLALNVDQTKLNNLLPGVYRFNITESDTSVAGIEKDGRTLALDVFITSEDGENRIAKYYVVSAEGNKTDLAFDNKLTTTDLTLTKRVTGNQANKSDVFDFTIKVTSTTDKTISYTYTNADNPSGQTATLKTNTDQTLQKIGDANTIKFEGLSNGDKVLISEKDTNNYGGYRATATYADTKLVDDKELPVTEAEFTVSDGNTEIAWENNRSADIPTGLIENIAPFVIAIAAAGFILFIYFKNNKKEEELA